MQKKFAWGTGFVGMIALASAWAVRAETGKVVSFAPQGTAKAVRQVQVRFSEPMVPFGDPRGLVSPFEVNCAASGHGRWVDPRNWVYDFEKDLPGGLECAFTAKADGAIYRFSTGGPSVLASRPNEGDESIEEDPAFMLWLDAAVARADVEARVKFRVAGMSDAVEAVVVEGAIRDQLLKSVAKPWNLRGPADAFHVLVVKPKLTFPSGARVELVWPTGMKSAGGVATTAERRIPFKVREPFQATFTCERERPEADCVPVSSVGVSFSAPVLSALASQIRVREVKSGREWKPLGKMTEEETYSLRFGSGEEGVFPAQATFEITLPKGFTDREGRKLGNADRFPLRFKTEAFPPLVKFASDFSILELKASPALPVTLRAVEKTLPAAMISVGEVGGASLRLTAASAESILKWLSTSHGMGAEGANDPRGKSVLTGAGSVQKFKLPKPNGSAAFEVVGIPLEKPGFYVIELESPMLGERLLGEKRKMFVNAQALVTDLGVHFKEGRERSLAWVTSLATGKPVAGARVAVRDCSGKALQQGVTDASGLVFFSELPTESEKTANACAGLDYTYRHGRLVTAESGEDFSFVHTSWNRGIESWRYQLRWEEGSSGPNVPHTVLARTLLRAGEAVHMKHFLRRHTTRGMAQVPSDARPKTLRIEHTGSGQSVALPLRWAADGTAETVWTAPASAKLGTYALFYSNEERAGGVSTADGDEGGRGYGNPGWYAGRFRIEEFRVPLIQGRIQGPAGTAFADQRELSFDVQAQHLSGGPAGGLATRVRTQVAASSLGAVEGFEEFEFASAPYRPGVQDESREREPASALTTDVTLDAQGGGRVAVRVPAPQGAEPSGVREVTAEFEFPDPNGEVRTSATRVKLYPAARLVGIKPPSSGTLKDSLTAVTAVVTPEGKAVAGADVEIEVLERTTYSHRKKLVGGFYAYESRTEIKSLGSFCQGKTGADGRLECSGSVRATGNLILQARTKDPQGRESFASGSTWIYGSEETWFEQGDSDRIDLLPTRKRWEPGETATFQLRMPFKEAEVLVTVEREGVIDAFTTHVDRTRPTIEVPLRGSYAPNVFVSALALRGRVGDVQPTAFVDLGRPAYKLGIAEIWVGWKVHELDVRVTPAKSVYKARDRARATVRVALPGGAAPPVGTEVAVAVIDEALLELEPNPSWDLLRAMMRLRGYEVQTSTAQMQVVGKRHFGLKSRPPGGDGGKAPTRELFDTLALWKARVPVNGRGEATVDIPLGDSLSSFRVVAIASQGADRFGTGSASFRVSQDLMILAGLPPVARTGDEFSAEVTVRNASERKQEVTVSGGHSGDAHAYAAKTLTLEPGKAQVVRWSVKAPALPDVKARIATAFTWQHEFRVADRAGKVRDSLKWKTEVTPVYPVRVLQATLARLSGTQTVPVEKPAGAEPGGGIQAHVQATLLSGMEGVRAYMGAYPYNCMEQKVSRAVSLRSREQWEKAAGEMASYLDADGLLKFFPLMDQGSEVLTAYVLSIADEASWSIPTAARDRMLTGLAKFVAGEITRHGALPTADLTFRRLAAVEALSRYGRISWARFGAWIGSDAEIALWPTSALLDWLQVLDRLKEIPQRDARRKQAETLLRARMNFQGTTLGFSTESVDALWWLMVSTDVNAVRALGILAGRAGWAEDAPRLVRGALGRQQRGHWDLTSANAWGVLAVEKFSRLYESRSPQGETTVELGSVARSIDWGKTTQGGEFLFPWAESDANGGGSKDTLKATHTGAGVPWLTVQSLAALPLREPFSSGYAIHKTVTAIEQKKAGRWTRGDLLRVRLEIDAQADRTWIVAEDPLPPGSQILSGGLVAGKVGADQRTPTYVERSFTAWRGYFGYAPKGRFAVEYVVRLNQDGVFRLPATRVTAMYSPEMFGEIPNAPMEIDAP